MTYNSDSPVDYGLYTGPWVRVVPCLLKNAFVSPVEKYEALSLYTCSGNPNIVVTFFQLCTVVTLVGWVVASKINVVDFD